MEQLESNYWGTFKSHEDTVSLTFPAPAKPNNYFVISRCMRAALFPRAPGSTLVGRPTRTTGTQVLAHHVVATPTAFE